MFKLSWAFNLLAIFFTHLSADGGNNGVEARNWSQRAQKLFWQNYVRRNNHHHRHQFVQEEQSNNTNGTPLVGMSKLIGNAAVRQTTQVEEPRDAYCDSFNVDIHPDEYPEAARNESVVERHCGVKDYCVISAVPSFVGTALITLMASQVMDPYRWMENPELEGTKKFVSALNNLSRPFLQKSFYREKFRSKMNQLFDQKSYGCITKHGDFYYYGYSEGDQKQSLIYRQRTLTGPKELFMDPNKLSVDGTISIEQMAFSRDGSMLAYALSEKGSDVHTIRFRRANGQELPDQIANVKQSSLAWMPNNKGIFYSKYAQRKRATESTKVPKDEFHSLYYHRIGTKSEKDILIVDFQELHDPNLLISGHVSRDGRLLFVYVYDRDNSYTIYYVDLKATNYKIRRHPPLSLLIHDTRASFLILDYDHESKTALVLTDHSAPMRRLIRVQMSTAMLGPAHWETVIPEDPKRALESVVPVAGDKLMVIYIEDVKTFLYVHSYKTGKLLYKIPLGIGTVGVCYGDREDTEAFFSFNSFLEPPAFYRADFSEVEKTSLLQLENIRHTNEWQGVNVTDLEVRQEFFESKDGTKVPIFIIAHKDVRRDGKNPALLYGYGGFNIPILPTYSSHRNIFVKHFHGIVAIANIRGGGEYGDKWHECGAREHKQNVFDDFISAAEYLVEKKYTSPKKLAIQGGSNGGLLVAVCSQQRPELFGAVINQVGVMDMLRFHKFTVGGFWINEYGDPTKPCDFEYIYRYSPLHNIRLPRGVQWPATLLMTADHDDRVVPSHTLKYAAQLYNYLKRPEVRLIQRNPVLARVETDAGHGAGKPRDKVIDELVDIVSFLQRVLQLKWHEY